MEIRKRPRYVYPGLTTEKGDAINLFNNQIEQQKKQTNEQITGYQNRNGKEPREKTIRCLTNYANIFFSRRVFHITYIRPFLTKVPFSGNIIFHLNDVTGLYIT